MTYKILVTTVATRLEAVSVDTKEIELEFQSEAYTALENLTSHIIVGNTVVKQTATPINFKRMS